MKEEIQEWSRIVHPYRFPGGLHGGQARITELVLNRTPHVYIGGKFFNALRRIHVVLENPHFGVHALDGLGALQEAVEQLFLAM